MKKNEYNPNITIHFADGTTFTDEEFMKKKHRIDCSIKENEKIIDNVLRDLNSPEHEKKRKYFNKLAENRKQQEFIISELVRIKEQKN